MTEEEKLTKTEIKSKLKKLVKELKSLCIHTRIPMFLSIADIDDDGKIAYDNHIVSAAIDMPAYTHKINKLILAIKSNERTLPDNIKRDIEDIEKWLEDEYIYDIDRNIIYDEDMSVSERFRDFYDIVNGQIVATIPSALTEKYEEDEIEGIKIE